MAGRRVRIQFDDGNGGRYAISLEGSITRDKVAKLMDLVELLSPQDHTLPPPVLPNTRFADLYQVLESHFPLGAFTSADVLEAYEDACNRPVKLSTVSTYLSRLTERGILKRERSLSGWTYRRARPGPTP